uniref:Uncharacterized protein n=1 Tax=Quercus lobata TaxID=97700 RepID=A0A7N2M284_QUELO
MARREAGETSSGISEDPELKSRIKSVLDAKRNVKPPQTPKIQKVISVLRGHKDFQKHYEPRAISIGPIHHGDKKYELGEKHKLMMTNEFVNGSAEKINDLYKKVGEKIMELRACYIGKANKKFEDDKALAWLMLVDGCATLQYIYCAEKNKFKDLDIKPDCVAFTQLDLFLIENQLPNCLLKWLMNWNGNESTLEGLIKSYIDKQAILTLPKDQLSVFLKLCPSSLSWNLA